MNLEVPINYDINAPTEANSWDGEAHPISISDTWSFWKLIPKTFSLLDCEWLIISELGKFTKLVGIPFLSRISTSPSGMQS